MILRRRYLVTNESEEGKHAVDSGVLEIARNKAASSNSNKL